MEMYWHAAWLALCIGLGLICLWFELGLNILTWLAYLLFLIVWVCYRRGFGLQALAWLGFDWPWLGLGPDALAWKRLASPLTQPWLRLCSGSAPVGSGLGSALTVWLGSGLPHLLAQLWRRLWLSCGCGLALAQLGLRALAWKWLASPPDQMCCGLAAAQLRSAVAWAQL